MTKPGPGGRNEHLLRIVWTSLTRHLDRFRSLMTRQERGERQREWRTMTPVARCISIVSEP